MIKSECDLVLLHNDDFYLGSGMAIHIRTTQESFYSYIESVAIRMGDDILEFTGDDFYINGVQGSDSDLPTTIGGFVDIVDSPHLPTTVGGFPLHYPTFREGVKHYLIDLNEGDYLNIYKYKHFMAVHLRGSPRDFDSAVGLMGDFHSSKMLARDGMTVVHDADEFIAEWQVHGDEDKLFRRALREPQHPHATCRRLVRETTEEARRRHLREDRLFVSAAEAACAKSNQETKHEIEFCVHDVLVTNDLGMAEVWQRQE
jgi:hypothetical protein